MIIVIVILVSLGERMENNSRFNVFSLYNMMTPYFPILPRTNAKVCAVGLISAEILKRNALLSPFGVYVYPLQVNLISLIC